MAKWRNWQTHQTQNLAHFSVRVGSTPTFATIRIYTNVNCAEGLVAEAPPAAANVTLTAPVPVPVTTMTSESERKKKFCGAKLPNETLETPVKPDPVIVTTSPPLAEPLVAFSAVITGAETV